MKHTDGPWIIHEYKDQIHGIDITEGKKGKVICNITSHFTAKHEEAQANAKLIAAAPKLLEALRFCKSVIESQGIYDRSESLAVDKATEAIKEATE
jgi:hypothetical protein